MRTIVITGATSGFGKGLVDQFLRNGDRVIATGRNLSKREDALAGERALAMGRLIEKDLDVTSSEQRKAFALFCRTEVGRVDILVNNAGFGLFGSLEEVSEEQMRYQMEVNFFGLSLLTQELLPLIRFAKGKIFNVSSVLGFTGFPLSSLYCASKHAVEGLSESLAFELAPHGVQVCLIEPGSYGTGFGANVAWATDANETTSPYRLQNRNYTSFRERLGSGFTLNNPADVPRGIVKLSRQNSLPLRKQFGLDSRATRLARAFLPEGLVKFVMNLFFRTMINRGA